MKHLVCEEDEVGVSARELSSSWCDRSRWALLFASVCCWTPFMQHLRCRSLWIICETDKRWIPPRCDFFCLFNGSDICLPDSAPVTPLCQRFHQYMHCDVCHCPDTSWLFWTFSTSPAPCWCCYSPNLYLETVTNCWALWSLHSYRFLIKFCLLYSVVPCLQAVWCVIFITSAKCRI